MSSISRNKKKIRSGEISNQTFCRHLIDLFCLRDNSNCQQDVLLWALYPDCDSLSKFSELCPKEVEVSDIGNSCNLSDTIWTVLDLRKSLNDWIDNRNVSCSFLLIWRYDSESRNRPWTSLRLTEASQLVSQASINTWHWMVSFSILRPFKFETAWNHQERSCFAASVNNKQSDQLLRFTNTAYKFRSNNLAGKIAFANKQNTLTTYTRQETRIFRLFVYHSQSVFLKFANTVSWNRNIRQYILDTIY